MTDNQEQKKPDLDSLLDEALEDFNKPLAQNATKSGETATANEWTEEFIQEATKNFEKTMRHMMASQNAGAKTETPVGDTGIDFDGLAKEFMKMSTPGEAAPKAEEQDFIKTLNETMTQLKNSTEDTKMSPDDDFKKIFESGEGENKVEGMFALMQSMLENLLSKEVLYEPMKEIVDKFPEWLQENKSTLSTEDFSRYNSQYEIMKKVVEMFDKQTENQSAESKTRDFEQIMNQMQKLQDLGQPPAALMGDFTNPLDGAGSKDGDNLSDLMKIPGLMPGSQPDGDQCSIM